LAAPRYLLTPEGIKGHGALLRVVFVFVRQEFFRVVVAVGAGLTPNLSSTLHPCLLQCTSESQKTAPANSSA
jgi:hypothetical protein